MTKLISTNPAKGYDVVGEIQISTDREIQEKVAAAQAAKTAWKELGIEKRIELIRPICEEFEKRSEEVAHLITDEVGKTFGESLDMEVKGALRKCDWFLENAHKALDDEVSHEDDESLHRVVREPYGVAAVITPWNYPFSMAVWGIIPNLLVGNTVIFKISEECPLIGKLIEDIINNSNLPEGIFTAVHGAGDAGEKLAKSDVDLIWFTGSTKTGQALYKIAAEKFIKVVLEMGGSNPCIIFEDVDVARAVERIYEERYENCGQVCDAVKRLIVHESIFDEVVAELKKIVEDKKVGDPLDEGTDIGSLVAKRQLDLIEEQVKDAVDKGAKVVTGGKLPEGLEGAYFAPTILTSITKDMRVWSEEVFAPVLPVVSFKTEKEAIELANDTIYGLGSRVMSRDIERAQRVAAKIDVGSVDINYGSHWLACNPFGGYKKSGMGREHGVIGFRELCQIKVISMDK